MSTAEDQTMPYPEQQELIGEPAAMVRGPEDQPHDDQVDEQETKPHPGYYESTGPEVRSLRRRHRWELLGGSFTVGDETSTVERFRCRHCGLQARKVPTRSGRGLRLEVLPDGATEWTPELAPCPGDSDGRIPDDVDPLLGRTVELEHQVEQLQREITLRGELLDRVSAATGGGSVEQVETMAKELTSLRATPAPVPGPSPAAGRRPLPQTRSGRTLRFDIGLAHGYITVGEYDDGTLGELFVIVAKEGGPLRGMLDSWARLFSVALQHGVDLADLVRAFRGSSFEPSGWSDVPGIGRASSIPDLVVRWLEQQYLPAPAAETEQPLGAQP